MRSFISYARKDASLKDKFRGYLKPIEDSFGISVFDDQAILPGESWEKRIWAEFEASQIIFVLVTENFLASEFCLRKEFSRAVDRHNLKQVTIVPIILKPCEWQTVDSLKSLQVLPSGAKAITGGAYKPQSRGYASVVSEIRKLLFAISPKKPERLGSRPAKPTLDKYRDTPFKAAFFDLDGTLIRGKVGHDSFRYSWQLVWSHCGFDDSDRKKYYQQYLDEKISYQQWCNITRDLFRERGLQEKHFKEIAKKVRLTKNCRESLRILKRRGVKLILVSGGIDSFLRAAFPDYDEFFDYVFINKFHYDSDGVVDAVETTKFDFNGKFDAIEYVRQKYNFEYSECVFVGEGRNDIYAAKELNRRGGLTIGYPAEHLQDFATYDLWKDRLDAVLDLMFGRIIINRRLLDNAAGEA